VRHGRSISQSQKVNRLWEWAFGGDGVVGVDELLRGLNFKMAIALAIGVLALAANNPITQHYVELWLGTIHPGVR
jgi:hypothetical protein